MMQPTCTTVTSSCSLRQARTLLASTPFQRAGFKLSVSVTVRTRHELGLTMTLYYEMHVGTFADGSILRSLQGFKGTRIEPIVRPVSRRRREVPLHGGHGFMSLMSGLVTRCYRCCIRERVSKVRTTERACP